MYPKYSIQAYDSTSFYQQVTLQQTSTWVNVKFSTLIKILAEKQEATELFTEEQKEAAITEAEARLAELKERSQILEESREQIAAVLKLSDTELIKVCTSAFKISYIWLKWKDFNVTIQLYCTQKETVRCLPSTNMRGEIYLTSKHGLLHRTV